MCFVLFGRGADIDKSTFCILIHMQNDVLNNIQYVEIHVLADIDIDRHLGNDIDAGEEISNSIREIFLEADDNVERLLHSIERTMRSDMTRSLHLTEPRRVQ
jgi:hypothetical protein